MENKKKLSSFLLEHYKELDLKAKRVAWVKEWLPGFYDFEVAIRIDGKLHTGRGIDKDSDLAFTKASAEALERAICTENKTSSCGVALHTDYELAKQNSQNELIERDRFFCHYLTKTPFKKINPSISGIDFSNIQEKLKDHDASIQVFEMASLNDTKSIVCISQGEKTGLVLGLGASHSKELAIQKAITECLVNVVAALYEKVSPPSLPEFENELSRSENHRKLYLKETELIKENNWLLTGNSEEKDAEFISPDSFKYQEITTKNALLREAPIFVIKCINPLLQKSFYGNFDAKYINIEQIQRFSRTPIKPSQLNRLPHSLG